MSKYFQKGKLNQFQKSHKGFVTGAFFPEGTLNHDKNIEINFSVFDEKFRALPHYHSKTKTWVIVTKGKMYFRIEEKDVEVAAGEFLIFQSNVIEEVIKVDPGTESFTIHSPSIIGGDKVLVAGSDR